jgi:RNA polymerase sigma-70 factor (ECF subfamily)
MEQDVSQAEATIRAALGEGRPEDALRLTLTAYGAEIYGFLVGELHDTERAQEVFALFGEDLWRVMPRLELRTTMRAYCYTVSRHALFRYLDSVVRKERKGVPLSQADWSALVVRVRTETAEYLRSDARDRIAALRNGLSEDERTLLMLRIDRGLSFREITEVLGDTAGEGDPKTQEARLRKRFQLLKDKLRKLALAAGIAAPKDKS